VICQYRDKDVYTADETVLIYKLAPNETLALKGDGAWEINAQRNG
jgi:hypothetical protein